MPICKALMSQCFSDRGTPTKLLKPNRTFQLSSLIERLKIRITILVRAILARRVSVKSVRLYQVSPFCRGSPSCPCINAATTTEAVTALQLQSYSPNSSRTQFPEAHNHCHDRFVKYLYFFPKSSIVYIALDRIFGLHQLSLTVKFLFVCYKFNC